MRYLMAFLAASALAGLGGAAQADVPRVIADIPPVHALVAQVMGDLGQPVLLLDAGANAHSFQLRPSQAAKVAGADLVIWIGPEMTPWLDRALAALAPDVAQRRLLAAEGTFLRAYADAGGAGDHAGHDHDHSAAPVEPGDDHDHSGTDPHAWLDPANAQTWLSAIAADLARLDPGNAATYTANAARAVAEVVALDARLASALTPLRDKPFVVFHDAYGYFADHYGLTIAATVALGDAAAPGAAHLAEVTTALRDALCIFPERQHDPKLVEALGRDTGTRIGGALDPEGAGLEPGPQVYAAILSSLADTLIACLAES